MERKEKKIIPISLKAFTDKVSNAQIVKHSVGSAYSKASMISDMGTICKTSLERLSGTEGFSNVLVTLTTRKGFVLISKHAPLLNKVRCTDIALATRNYKLVMINKPTGEIYFNIVTLDNYSNIIAPHVR